VRRLLRLALAAASLAVASAAAHADFLRLEPGVEGVVVGAPSEVTIHFTMGVEARFSTFKVYRLALDADALPAVLAAPTERERMRLNALAAALVAETLERDDDADHPDRVDDAAPTTSAGDTAVTLALSNDLPPGVYVVMWDVLAVDAHWTSGHRLLFVAAPPH
jgi:methionine-rich copper-binding protein CopC